MEPKYETTIVFSEWLSTGIMVHFKGGVSVFFPAQYLYDQREVPPNQLFQTDKEPRPKGWI
jgi:hypothetical protein